MKDSAPYCLTEHKTKIKEIKMITIDIIINSKRVDLFFFGGALIPTFNFIQNCWRKKARIDRLERKWSMPPYHLPRMVIAIQQSDKEAIGIEYEERTSLNFSPPHSLI